MVLLILPTGTEYHQPTGLFINNVFVETAETLDVGNPYDGNTICSVSVALEKHLDQAVDAATNAFESWKKVHVDTRSALLFKLAELVERDSELLATIESVNTGKTLSQSTAEILTVAAIYRYYGGWVDKLQGTTTQLGAKLALTLREPVGVCGAIVPWNFPLLIAAGWKLAPCLATGNTMVLKVSELTPLSMLYFCQLVGEAGFPPGVVNVVNGLGVTVGKQLAGHLKIAKISFTGSTAVGQDVMRTAAGNLKKVTLECGGKSGMLVLKDADVQKAALDSFQGCMSNLGQICSAITRVYVAEEVYQDFLAAVKKLVSLVRLGNPFNKDTFLGPQISRLQKHKIDRYIASAINEGATLLIGGHEREGNFICPTVFCDVKPHHTVVQQEIFGPVLVVAKFSKEEEGIALMNDTNYGLLASVFTNDATKALAIAKSLHAGQVFINSGNDIDFRVPFGGYKMSGFGKELGKEALDGYTQVKAVHMDLSKANF